MKLEEEAKSVTTFTVGPLGFWESERMPFLAHQCTSKLLEVDGFLPR